MPFHSSYRAANALIRGWTIAGKVYAYSGNPFTVVDNKLQRRISPNIGETVIAHALDPSIVGTVCTSIDTPCLTTAQFANKDTQADFGNITRNSFMGPGYFDIDTQVSKKIAIAEKIAFTLGANAFNVLNHLSFAHLANANNSANSVSAGTFGFASQTISPPLSAYGSGQGATLSGRVLVVSGKITF